MPTHNAANERLKRDYLAYLKEAKRQSEASLDAVAKALHRFESHTRFRDFRAFHREQAVAFKRQLTERTSERTGEPLSKATVYATLTALRHFFHWLAGQPGFKSRLSYSDAEYFNLSDKETRIAKAHREPLVPTLEQIKRVIAMMPSGSDLERRDRALIAFAILTGARDGALASFKLKHVDLANDRVDHDARQVKTKFSKTFTTFFFPVGDEIRELVEDWVNHLLKEKLWGLDDPLFPATQVSRKANSPFEAVGLERRHWSNATPIRTIFRRAFNQAGLPYFNPHSFRKTLGRLAQTVCRTPEAIKAWSQNLGHESVLTTFLSYGTVPVDRQAEIMGGLARSEPSTSNVADIFASIRLQLDRLQPPR